MHAMHFCFKYSQHLHKLSISHFMLLHGPLAMFQAIDTLGTVSANYATCTSLQAADNYIVLVRTQRVRTSTVHNYTSPRQPLVNSTQAAVCGCCGNLCCSSA